MEVVSGCTIQDECVVIDGKRFTDCTLINCILEYSGDPVDFVRTRMRGCRYVFYGRARHTVQFLQGTGLMLYDPAKWGEFCDQVN